MRKVLTAVLFLGLLVSHAASQVPDDKLIAPGIGIGPWTLQMTLAELATMNGVPGSSGRDGSLDTNRPESSWVRWHDVHALVARVRPDAQVDVLEIRSEDYKTAKGIGAGVPRDVVELVYGKPTAVTLLSIPPTFSGWSNTVRLIYDQMGLYFEIGQTRKGMTLSFSVGVFRPGAARQLWKF